MINVGGSATNISKPLVKKMLKTNAEKERKIVCDAVLQLLPSLTFGASEPTRTRSGKSISELRSEITEMDEQTIQKLKAKEAHRHQILQDLNSCKLFDAYLENQKPFTNNSINLVATPTATPDS